MTKQEIRTQMKAKRRSISKDFKRQASHSICKKILAAETLKKASTVAIYIDSFNEVETNELLVKLIEQGKRVCVPLCNTNSDTLTLHYIKTINELTPGAWGIPEPSKGSPICPPGDVDVIIVPGVAFDKSGNRIGFGKGYYDRLLSTCSPIKIGICYGFQVVEQIPTDGNDIKMDYIITEE